MYRWRDYFLSSLLVTHNSQLPETYAKYYNLFIAVDKMASILADDIFKCIFLNEKFCIVIRISLKFVPNGPIDNEWALVQIMAWRFTKYLVFGIKKVWVIKQVSQNGISLLVLQAPKYAHAPVLQNSSFSQ